MRKLVTTLLTALAAACLAASAQAQALWPQDGSDLPPDPAVHYGQLDNGLRYAILENRLPSGTGALRLRIDAGSLMEDEDQRGLAHVLEHMAFNGSAHVPEGQMVPMLERAGLAFGPDTNAYTSIDETVYQLDLPQVDAPTLDTAFELFGEIADDLTIAPDALDRERGVVLSEKRAGETYAQKYRDAAQDFFFDGARFADRDPIGTEDVIRTASAERVRDFYEAYYRPERALVVFVGDAPADQIEARIRATFSDWKVREPDGGEPDRGAVAPRGLAADQYADPNLPTVVTLEAERPAAPYVDTIAARRDRLLRNLGFAILSRRLDRMSRNGDAPFISASADYSRVYDTVETADLTLMAEAGAWEGALSAGEKELRRALEHGFSQAELDEQLAGLRASFQAQAKSADTRRTPGLADGLAGTLGADMVFTHPSTDLQRFEAIASGVTVEQVEAAFRAAWGEGPPAIFLGAPQPVEGGADAIEAAYKASRAVPVEAPAETAGGEFAYTDFGPPGAAASREHIDDLDITEVKFANNVRLNVKPTPFSKDRVSVSVRVGAGRLELPKDMPGLEYLTESTFVSAGLKAHSIDDLQTLLAGENVGLDFYVDDDAFVFSAVATPEDLALQLELFAAYMTDPGYREEALTRFRRSLDSWYESMDATPGGVMSRDVPKLLRSGDPRYGVPEQDALGARTLDEVHAALEKAFASGAIEVGIVGDIDPDTAISEVARTFGALGTREDKIAAFDEARALRFPEPTAEPVALHHTGEKSRALALAYWPTVDDRDTQLTRVITLATEVLQLKLTDRIREAEGESYSPSAFAIFSDVSPGYGYIGTELEVEPDKLGGVFAAVDEIVTAMAKGEVSDDELERARAPVLADIGEAEESNGYWIRVASIAQTRPEVLEDHRTRTEGFKAVTREQVIEAAKTWLAPARAFRVAISPETEAPALAAAEEATAAGAKVK